MSRESTNWGVMENVAAIAFHMGDSSLWEDAYKAAANHMGGSVGFYQAAVEMGVSLEEYSKKHKISWGSGADWISTIEVLPGKLLGFMIETGRLPDERERVQLIKASIQE